jgi:hypothetical protein
MFARITVSFLLLALLTAIPALSLVAQRGSDEPRVSANASVSQTIGVTEVTISYGRPGVKGRTIWGDLVPYGEVWRAGANEATTISFSSDVLIEDQKVAAGTYALFAIPGQEEWTVIFNKTAKQWGAFSHDAGQDALRVKVKAKAAPHEEWMSFSFEKLSGSSAHAVLRWEKLAVPFGIQVAQ